MRKFILNTEAARQIADDIEELFGPMPNYRYETILASIDHEWDCSTDEHTIGDLDRKGDPRWLISEEVYKGLHELFIKECGEEVI